MLRAASIVRTVWLISTLALAAHVFWIFFKGSYAIGPLAGSVLDPISIGRAASLLALLVAVRAGVAVAARPAQPRRAPTALFIFASLLAVYLANGKTLWSGDTLPMRYLPHSVVREQDFDLDEFPFLYVRGGSHFHELRADHPGNKLRLRDRDLPYYVVRSGPHYISWYPAAASLIAAPFYVVSALGGLEPDHSIFEPLEKLTAASLVAVSAALLYLVLLRLTSPGWAVSLAFVYGVATSSLSVSGQALWQHGPSQLAIVATLYAAVRATGNSAWLLTVGLCFGCAVLFRPTDLIALAPLVLYSVRRQYMKVHLVFLGGLPPAVFLLAYNWFYFGNPLARDIGAGSGYWVTPIAEGLAGLLVSPGRGLFIYSPILTLSVYYLVRSWRPGGDPLLRSLSLGVAATVLVYSKWLMWWGGHSYGPRLLSDLAPLLVVALYPARDWVRRSRVGRVVFVATLLFSVYAHALGAFVDRSAWSGRVNVDANPHRLWDWRDNPITDSTAALAWYVSSRLGL